MTLKPRDLILRCYAEHKNGQWQAFCLDLCLAAQADTFNEARRKLSDMIPDYLEEALEGKIRPMLVSFFPGRLPCFRGFDIFVCDLSEFTRILPVFLPSLSHLRRSLPIPHPECGGKHRPYRLFYPGTRPS